MTQMHGEVIEIECDDPGQAIPLLNGLGIFEEVALYGVSIHVVSADAEAHLPRISAALAEQQINVTAIARIAPSLEDVFISSAREAEKTLGVR